MSNITHITMSLPPVTPGTAEEVEATKHQAKVELTTIEYSGRASSSEERSEYSQARFALTAVDMPKQATSFAERIDKVSKQIESSEPSLKDKRWDFSINEHDEFVVSGKGNYYRYS